MKTYDDVKKTLAECEATEEPVFLLRGHDALAAGTIAQYHNDCKMNHCDDAFLADLIKVYAKFEGWMAQSENHDKIKMPD